MEGEYWNAYVLVWGGGNHSFHGNKEGVLLALAGSEHTATNAHTFFCHLVLDSKHAPFLIHGPSSVLTHTVKTLKKIYLETEAEMQSVTYLMTC